MFFPYHILTNLMTATEALNAYSDTYLHEYHFYFGQGSITPAQFDAIAKIGMENLWRNKKLPGRDG